MIDLHTHSTHSDGTLTPTQLVEQAALSGVTALALTDHNTVSGLPEFLEAATRHGLEGIPGVEFSTEHEGGELHILGLFISREQYDAVEERLRQVLERKEQSNRALIRALAAAGVVLDYDAIRTGMPGGVVNRAVIAAEMVRLGYCGSVKEAFQTWLSQERGYFCPPKRPDALDTVRFIRSIGAVSVLAHPFLNLQEEPLRRFLALAVPAGLDAMETRYSTYTPEQTALADRLAAEFGLLPSGGSDFHGTNKPDILLGRGRGDLQVPKTVLRRLIQRKYEKNERMM